MFWLHKILYQQTATMQYLEISKMTILENYVAYAIQGLKLADVMTVETRRGKKGTFGQIVWQYKSQSLALSFFLIYFEKALFQ